MKPYGYVRKDGEGLFIYGEHQFENAMGAELVPVYLHPKEWVELTDAEIDKESSDYYEPGYEYGFRKGALWAEDKLKEKNT